MEKYLKSFQTYAKKNPVVIGLIVLAIFIVVLGWIFIYQYKANIKKYNAAVTAQQEIAAEEAAATTTPAKPTPAVKKPAVPKAPGDATQAYTDALKTYASRRVQLSNCVATPNKMTYQNGTALMFDNRDNAAIQVLLDGKSNSIGALGFKVITLSSATLPHSVKIDCIKGGTPAYNIASVDLQ